MQVEGLSNYLSQIMHMNNASSVNSENTVAAQSTAGTSAFDNYYNSYISGANKTLASSGINYEDLISLLGGKSNVSSAASSTSTSEGDDRTSLQVAQDAYSEFLTLASDAISGSTKSSNNSALNSTSADSQDTSLSDAIQSYLNSVNGTK